MRHFRRIAEGIEVGALLLAIAHRPEVWRMSDVRSWHRASPHYRQDDIVLRFQPWERGEDYYDKVLASLHCVDYPALALLPAARHIIDLAMEITGGTKVGRAYISRVPPGGQTRKHVDRIPKAEQMFPGRPVPSEFYQKHHLILQSAPGCVFRTGDESIEMRAGELWWNDALALHGVENCSSVDWIQVAIDIHNPQW